MAGISGSWEEINRDPLAGIKALLGGVIPEQWPGRGGATVLPETGGGMTPLPVNPEAIRTFTERVNPPGQLTGNIGNLPTADFLRMLYNPNVAAPTPAPSPTMAPAGPVTSPIDMSVAAARKMAGQYAGAPGLLPWDFWLKNPNVAGGMMRVEEGPKAGQTYSFFEPAKPPNIMDNINALIQDYQKRLTDFATMPTGGGREESIQRSRQMHMFDAYTKGFGAVMEKLLTAGKVPSEIGKAESETAKNLAESRRWQLAPNVFAGPAEQATFASQAGGPWEEIARGGPQERMTPLEATEKRLTELELSGWIDAYSKEFTPESKAFALGKINETLARARGAQPQATQQKITQKDYTAWAKKQGYTDAQIKAELQTLISRGLVY